jgi:acetyl-CoA/propionyl-CoA carboxylase biotin carboxyl carrier protein
VKAQIRIAAGEPLWFEQGDLAPRGHAIECRINAESPANSFLPCPGRIASYSEPGGPGVRIDSAAFEGWVIGSDYDSLIAKLVAWGSDRTESRERMARALREYSIGGVETTIPFYQMLLASPEFVSADYSTFTVDSFVREKAAQLTAAYNAQTNQSFASPTAIDGAGGDGVPVTVEVNDRQYRVRVFGLSATNAVAPARRYSAAKKVAYGGPAIESPMHGILSEIRVRVGDEVESGQVVAVIEAMKMMNEVTAHRPGTVASVSANIGETVESGAALVVLEESAS